MSTGVLAVGVLLIVSDNNANKRFFVFGNAVNHERSCMSVYTTASARLELACRLIMQGTEGGSLLTCGTTLQDTFTGWCGPRCHMSALQALSGTQAADHLLIATDRPGCVQVLDALGAIEKTLSLGGQMVLVAPLTNLGLRRLSVALTARGFSPLQGYVMQNGLADPTSLTPLLRCQQLRQPWPSLAGGWRRWAQHGLAITGMDGLRCRTMLLRCGRVC